MRITYDAQHHSFLASLLHRKAVCLSLLALYCTSLYATNGSWSAQKLSGGEGTVIDQNSSGGVSFKVKLTQSKEWGGLGFLKNLESEKAIVASKLTGKGGLIVVSDLALESTFLSVWIDEKATLKVAARISKSASVQHFALPGYEGIQELKLVRRADMVYAYAKSEESNHSLVALQFEQGAPLRGGLVSLGDFACEEVSESEIALTQTLTTDLKLDQLGVRLKGDWKEVSSDESLGGSYLWVAGEREDDSIEVNYEEVFPGEHELWIRYPEQEGASAEIAVDIEGGEQKVESGLNQQVSGGLWIGVGNQKTEKQGELKLKLQTLAGQSGSMSVDALHYVWADWDDENKDDVPDVLEAQLSGLDVKREVIQVLEENESKDLLMKHWRLTLNPSKDADVSGERSGGWDVMYVSESMGNDLYSGKSSILRLGARVGHRDGPKRTIDAALELARESKKLELHLDGKLQSPVGGFHRNGIKQIRIISSSKGAQMGD